MKDKKPLDSFKYLGLITQVGLSMVTPIMLGVFIGLRLDQKFSTKGLFFIIFLLMGIGGAFSNLFKLQKMRRDNDGPRSDNQEDHRKNGRL